MPQIIERSRASPPQLLTVPFKHTQDFINALSEGASPQEIKNPILGAMADALINHRLADKTHYLACPLKLPSFKFSFISPADQNIAPRLFSGIFPASKHVSCRKCQQETFFFEIIIIEDKNRNNNNGKRREQIKAGYLTIECFELVLDFLDLKDFGLKEEE